MRKQPVSPFAWNNHCKKWGIVLLHPIKKVLPCDFFDSITSDVETADSSDYYYYPKVEDYDFDSADYYPESEEDYDFDNEDDEEEDPDDVGHLNEAHQRLPTARFVDHIHCTFTIVDGKKTKSCTKDPS